MRMKNVVEKLKKDLSKNTIFIYIIDLWKNT